MANSTVAVLVPWLVLKETGSAADAGLVAAAAAIPGIFVSPFVGALVDRFGRRRVSMASDAFSAVSVSLFPLAEGAGVLTLGMILALAVLGATSIPRGTPRASRSSPTSPTPGRFYIDRINGVHEGVFAAGWVIGPALAAIGISTIGVIATFWVTAAAFVLAIMAVGGIRVTEAIGESRHEAGDDSELFWSSIVRGARILWHDKALRVLTLAIAVLAMVYLPTESILMPVHFEAIGQPGSYGLTLTALAAGGMIGSFSYGWLSSRMSKHRIVVLVMFAVTTAIIPMAFLPPLPVFVAAGFLLGLVGDR